MLEKWADSRERGKALRAQTGHLSSVYANQSLPLGLQTLQSRELLRCASIPIWAFSVCKLRLWGCWYIPNLELGCSQSMPPDLRFVKRSGITSSRHSMGPLAWPGRLPSTVCVLTQLHAGVFCSLKIWPPGTTASQFRSSGQCSSLQPSQAYEQWDLSAKAKVPVIARVVRLSQSSHTHVSAQNHLFPVMPLYSFKS